MTLIENKTFDLERSLYNIKDTTIDHCLFQGPNDGESVLKECHNIIVKNTNFSLRYPIWHNEKFVLDNITMDSLTRAPLWYSNDGIITNSKIEGIKCLRECKNVNISDSFISSPEFGWKCSDISLEGVDITSEYLFFESKDLTLNRVLMKGKYSFQYVNNMEICDSNLDTKDAFWHSNNVVVKNSTIKGEYLGWFSNNLTLIDCKIIGTQPLCYCNNLKMYNCTMEEADFAFEYSECDCDIVGSVISVKNPLSGKITLDSVGEIIRDNPAKTCTGEVIIRK